MVVAHHKVVIHLEDIGTGRCPVDMDQSITYLQVVLFINIYNTLVYWQIQLVDLDGISSSWYLKRTKIITCPPVLIIVWIYLLVLEGKGGFRISADASHLGERSQ